MYRYFEIYEINTIINILFNKKFNFNYEFEKIIFSNNINFSDKAKEYFFLIYIKYKEFFCHYHYNCQEVYKKYIKYYLKLICRENKNNLLLICNILNQYIYLYYI